MYPGFRSEKGPGPTLRDRKIDLHSHKQMGIPGGVRRAWLRFYENLLTFIECIEGRRLQLRATVYCV